MSRILAGILTIFGRSPSPNPSKRRRFVHRLNVEPLELRPLMASIIPLDLGPVAINNAGQVAGTTAPPSGAGNNAAIYSGTQVTDLGTLGGSQAFSYGNGLNDAGQVVGASGTTNTTLGLPYHAFLYDGKEPLDDLGTLPGKKDSYAHGINNSGQIVGESSNSGLDDLSGHAFLYSGGTMIDLGTLNGGKNDTSDATAINDSGDVVGSSLTIASPSGYTHAFLYDGAMHDLGTLPGYSASYAVAVNDADQIVGHAVGNDLDRAFLDSGGKMADLGTLPDDAQSDAYAINNAAQVVGTSFSTESDSHAFLYSGGQMIDLDTLLPAGSGWTLQDARGINDNGQIVGFGTHDGVSDQGYMLDLNGTPPPPPSPGSVDIDINDTASNADNITLFNPPSTGEPAVQAIPAKITNTGTTVGTFQLSVSPAGSASLSQTSVTLAAGTGPDAYTEITITPEADSTSANDVHIIATQGGIQVGEDDMTIVGLTFSTSEGLTSPHIRNTDTPPVMTQDRIPPRVSTPLYVIVTPSLTGSGQSISLAVGGQSQQAGSVALDGSGPLAVLESQTVMLVGTSQTAATGEFLSSPVNIGSLPPLSIPDGVGQNAGQLIIDAIVGGQTIALSYGFSVAAIPIRVSSSNPVRLPHTPGFSGMRVFWGVQSDSGSPDDLTSLDISELVRNISATGKLQNVLFLRTSSWFTASEMATGILHDDHAVKTRYLARGASLTQYQAFEFRDTRTGANAVVVPDSGFVITQDVVLIRNPRRHSRSLFLITGKYGASVTVYGRSTEAGLTSPTSPLTYIQRLHP